MKNTFFKIFISYWRYLKFRNLLKESLFLTEKQYLYFFLRISVLEPHGSQIKSVFSWSYLDHVFCKCSPLLIKLFGCNCSETTTKPVVSCGVFTFSGPADSRKVQSGTLLCAWQSLEWEMFPVKERSLFGQIKGALNLQGYCLGRAHNKCLGKSNKTLLLRHCYSEE